MWFIHLSSISKSSKSSSVQKSLIIDSPPIIGCIFFWTSILLVVRLAEIYDYNITNPSDTVSRRTNYLNMMALNTIVSIVYELTHILSGIFRKIPVYNIDNSPVISSISSSLAGPIARHVIVPAGTVVSPASVMSAVIKPESFAR